MCQKAFASGENNFAIKSNIFYLNIAIVYRQY